MESPLVQWRHRTNKGKVVYESHRNIEDRPRKFFTPRDLFRIVRKVDRVGYFIIGPTVWYAKATKLIDFIGELIQSSDDEETEVEAKSLLLEEELEKIEELDASEVDFIIVMKGE